MSRLKDLPQQAPTNYCKSWHYDGAKYSQKCVARYTKDTRYGWCRKVHWRTPVSVQNKTYILRAACAYKFLCFTKKIQSKRLGVRISCKQEHNNLHGKNRKFLKSLKGLTQGLKISLKMSVRGAGGLCCNSRKFIFLSPNRKKMETTFFVFRNFHCRV